MKFFLKPLFWNPSGYRKPAGFRATGGFPKKNGYGHEEWNNSRRLRFEEGGISYRAFHTEGVEKLAAWANEPIVLFMYASHDGVQQLVGVAADPTCLFNKENERQALGSKLKIEAFWHDAWSLENVQAAYGRDRQRFLNEWRQNCSLMPNWTCRDDMYFEPDEPVTLDPMRIRGTSKLLTMFGSYTSVDLDTALRVMNSVPKGEQTPTWSRVTEFMRRREKRGRAKMQHGNDVQGQVDTRDHDLYDDLREIEARRSINHTTRQALVDARLGQGRFRSAVEENWGSKCAVTGCSQREMLRASHMKPWRKSCDQDRLDPSNGLLLSANLDALFDRGLISFDDEGSMIVSRRVSVETGEFIGIPRSLRRPLSGKERGYLRHHRDVIFCASVVPAISMARRR